MIAIIKGMTICVTPPLLNKSEFVRRIVQI